MLNGQKKLRPRNPFVMILREAKKSVGHGKTKKAERRAAQSNLNRMLEEELS